MKDKQSLIDRGILVGKKEGWNLINVVESGRDPIDSEGINVFIASNDINDFEEKTKKFFKSLSLNVKVSSAENLCDETCPSVLVTVKGDGSYLVGYDVKTSKFFVMVEKIYHGDYHTPDDSEYIDLREGVATFVDALAGVAVKVYENKYHNNLEGVQQVVFDMYEDEE